MTLSIDSAFAKQMTNIHYDLTMPEEEKSNREATIHSSHPKSSVTSILKNIPICNDRHHIVNINKIEGVTSFDILIIFSISQINIVMYSYSSLY